MSTAKLRSHLALRSNQLTKAHSFHGSQEKQGKPFTKSRQTAKVHSSQSSRDKHGKSPSPAPSKLVQAASEHSIPNKHSEDQSKSTTPAKSRQVVRQHSSHSENHDEEKEAPSTTRSKPREVVKKPSFQSKFREDQRPHADHTQRKEVAINHSAPNRSRVKQESPSTALSKWRQIAEEQPAPNRSRVKQESPSTALSKWRQIAKEQSALSRSLVKQESPSAVLSKSSEGTKEEPSENINSQGLSSKTVEIVTRTAHGKQRSNMWEIIEMEKGGKSSAKQGLNKTRNTGTRMTFVVPKDTKCGSKDTVDSVSLATPPGKLLFGNVAALLMKRKEKSSIQEASKAEHGDARKNDLHESLTQAVKEPCRTKTMRNITMAGQPVVSYDVLPHTIKNASFLVRLDLTQPRSRFVIVHRIHRNSFADLNANDCHDLISVVFDLGKQFDLNDLTLRIPLYCRCKRNFQIPFHAFVTVPIANEFIKCFRITVGDVPFWPSVGWRTKLWPLPLGEENMSACYERGVRENELAFNEPETWFRQRKLDLGGECGTFEMIVHPDQPLIGFSRQRVIGGVGENCDRVQELQSLMNHMYQVASDSKHFFSAMCISITGAYRGAIGWSRGILGFLDYTETEIPTRLLAQAERKSENPTGEKKQYFSVYVQKKKSEKKAEVLNKWKSARHAANAQKR